jgi:hypothetical protein
MNSYLKGLKKTCINLFNYHLFYKFKFIGRDILNHVIIAFNIIRSTQYDMFAELLQECGSWILAEVWLSL